MGGIMNNFTCRGKLSSFNTSACAICSDSDVAAAASALYALENQLIVPPLSVTATPETERRVSGHVAWSASTHTDGIVSADPPPYITPTSTFGFRYHSGFVTAFLCAGFGL